MMYLDRLDQDLNFWENEIAELEKHLAIHLGKSNQSLAGKLQTLHEERLQFGRWISLTRDAEASELPLSSPARAILYWAREFAERMIGYRDQYAEYLEKLLWLNLIRGRLLGQNSPFRIDMNEHEIGKILQKKHSLEQNEAMLREELSQLEEKEKILKSQYERHQYEVSMRQAAQCFTGQMGRLTNPKTTFDALGRLFRALSIRSHYEPEKLKSMQKMTVEFTRRSQSLLDRSNGLLRQGIDHDGSGRHWDEGQLQDNLTELKRLETEIDITLDLLINSPLDRKPLLLVKKDTKNGKSRGLSSTD